MQESVNSLRSLVSKTAQAYQGAANSVVSNGRSRRSIAPAAHHPRLEAPVQGRRPTGPQIPMPEERTSTDQDDRHFANF
jgi:hypothetical protein